MNLPAKFLVDTNVPITANQSLDQEAITSDMRDCIRACIEVIGHVTRNGGLVIDAGDEILLEYRNNLSIGNRPSVASIFMKWVFNNSYKEPNVERVSITRDGDSYTEFPAHKDLGDFDLSDRKFVAVANAHPQKPPIFQATDSKWWGWKDALKEVGIDVCFVCPEYVKEKYSKKFNT